MNREEVLNLHNLDEEEQYKWLKKNDLLKTRYVVSFNNRLLESLADCAFRLRDEANGVEFLYSAITLCNALNTFKTEADAITSYCWLINIAKPIHWIQCALLT